MLSASQRLRLVRILSEKSSLSLGRFSLGSALGVMLWTLAGCSSQIDERLVGTWRAEKPSSLNQRLSVNEEEGKEEQLAASPQMTIEFARSGGLTTTTRIGKIDSVKTGTWRTLSSQDQSNEDESSRIRIECQIGLQKTEHEIEYSDHSIFWIPPNLAGTRQKIRFVRAKD